MAKLLHQVSFITLSTFAAVVGCGGSDSAVGSGAPPQACNDAGLCTGGTEPPPGPNCGDGVVNPDEQCDGLNLNGSSCSAATMGSAPSGILGCKTNCRYDVRGCSGNGTTGG